MCTKNKYNKLIFDYHGSVNESEKKNSKQTYKVQRLMQLTKQKLKSGK